MRKVKLEKKKVRKPPPEGMWMRRKNTLDILKAFEEEYKKIRSMKEDTELVGKFLRNVFLYNKEQYVGVSIGMIDGRAEKLVEVLKTRPNLLVKKEQTNIESAMAEKQETFCEIMRWNHKQQMMDLEGIRGEQKLPQEFIKKLRACDKKILENMKAVDEKARASGDIETETQRRKIDKKRIRDT
jgi:hypothetical protein